MIVDVLRTCYAGRMRPGPGCPPFGARWYFTKPGAKFLPFPSCFGSAIYRERKDPLYTGVGEQGMRHWPQVGGRVEPRGAGQSYTGTPALFLNGWPDGTCPVEPLWSDYWPPQAATVDAIAGVV